MMTSDSDNSSDFFSKYLLYDPKKYSLVSIQKIIIIDQKKMSLYKSDLFSILDKKNVLGLFNELFSFKNNYEISVIITKMVSLDSFEMMKEKLVSYFGIYQKTKNVSSVYLFDKSNLVFIELTSGSLEGDDLIKSIALELIKKFEAKNKGIVLERHDFICDIDYDDEEFNELID